MTFAVFYLTVEELNSISSFVTLEKESHVIYYVLSIFPHKMLRKKEKILASADALLALPLPCPCSRCSQARTN